MSPSTAPEGPQRGGLARQEAAVPALIGSRVLKLGSSGEAKEVVQLGPGKAQLRVQAALAAAATCAARPVALQ
jgi:hypothetical protein